MPILERNRGLYPDDWPEIRQEVLERDGHRCKFCGVENYSDNPDTGAEVILTIAHLDHNPTNNGTPGKRPNLAALCQRCHNRHDAPHRQETRRESKRLALEGAGQGDIFERGGSGEDNLGNKVGRETPCQQQGPEDCNEQPEAGAPDEGD